MGGWTDGFAPGADGLRLHLVRGGQGRPVLLLHGWPGFWYDWRHVIPTLVDEMDVIAPDFRGFGDSDGPPGPTSTERDLVADMVRLLDHLGVERAVVAGHDIGAAVAQGLARRHPERVAALALFNPSHAAVGDRRYTPEIQPEHWYQHFHVLPWSDRLVGHNRETVELYLRHFYDHWTGKPESLQPDEFERIVDTYARPGAMGRTFAWYRGRLAERRRSALEPDQLVIIHPTVVRWGEADPVIPVSWAHGLADLFTDLDLQTLPGVGHFVPFEAPAEAADAIRSAARRAGW